jgi:hypothetical protein
MKEITVPLPTSDPADLGKFPHFLPQLIDMITGKCQLFPAQQEQCWQHLAECIHCQTFLGSYLVEIIKYDKAHNNPEGSAQELLIQLTQIMHKTLKEDIPAYVEALEEQREEEANSRFPLLADHLQACQDCQLAVQDLRSWLRQLGEAGML